MLPAALTAARNRPDSFYQPQLQPGGRAPCLSSPSSSREIGMWPAQLEKLPGGSCEGAAGQWVAAHKGGLIIPPGLDWSVSFWLSQVFFVLPHGFMHINDQRNPNCPPAHNPVLKKNARNFRILCLLYD